VSPTSRLPDVTAEAIELYRLILAAGPVACQRVGARAEGLGIPVSAQAQARRLLGVETIRGEDGEPRYRLPPCGRRA